MYSVRLLKPESCVHILESHDSCCGKEEMLRLKKYIFNHKKPQKEWKGEWEFFQPHSNGSGYFWVLTEVTVNYTSVMTRAFESGANEVNF